MDRFIKCALNRTGSLRSSCRGQARVSREAFVNSFARIKTCGGAICSGVPNSLDRRLVDPEPAVDDSIAIGTASNRHTITAAIQSKRGNETAYALMAIRIPKRVGSAYLRIVSPRGTPPSDRRGTA